MGVSRIFFSLFLGVTFPICRVDTLPTLSGSGQTVQLLSKAGWMLGQHYVRWPNIQRGFASIVRREVARGCGVHVQGTPRLWRPKARVNGCKRSLSKGKPVCMTVLARKLWIYHLVGLHLDLISPNIVKLMYYRSTFTLLPDNHFSFFLL